MKTARLLVLAFVLALVVAVVLASTGRGADPAPPDERTLPGVPAGTSTGFLTDPVPNIVQGQVAALRKQVKREHSRYLAAHRRVHQLTRTLAHHESTREALDLACAVYGNCGTLWSLARCESGLSPSARNPSGASGLLQFLPSTWAGTPFGRLSIWSPYANALAAGWMLAQGRRSEWLC